MLYLKSQVNPHFLYNTLDTIRIQAELDGDKKVAKLLMRLVDFFRLSVKVDRSMVTLDDELELVEAYMELMCYRYPELFCDYDIDPDLGAVQVPNFILQPLVENSLLHGMM
ncbi:sensor histidine kinase [Coprococcus hominis (ex Arizal et al. 2022)]